ncbi:hypothetical protein DINM_005143 [Dirofilaria immitis]|nr:hypothetical protein [Dirofilaria immitis]
MLDISLPLHATHDNILLELTLGSLVEHAIEAVMGTISKATFNRDIAELAMKTADLDLRYQWQFNDYKNGQFLSNSSVLEWNGETILQTFHITYNESYEVPVLWFIFSRQTGALLKIEEILELMPADKKKQY